MKILAIILLLVINQQLVRADEDYSDQMRIFSELYTSQKKMNENIKDLAQNECKDIMRISQLDDLDQTEEHLQLQLITISDPSQKEEEKSTAYYIFGEHPREIISSEVAHHFLQDICKGHKSGNKQVGKMLKDFRLLVVLDANPLGRQKVDNGDLCNRVNENGVDLNRNYDSNWKQNEVDTADQTYSGTHPFSERQTRAFDNLILQKQHIDLFLTVHSGAYGFYTPHAYDFEVGQNNKHNLEAINDRMNDYFCKCDHGCAGKLVGYLCPGTCLDYAYDKANVINSFAWEIYDQQTIDRMLNLFPTSKQSVKRMLKANNNQQQQQQPQQQQQQQQNQHSSFIQLKDVTRMNLEKSLNLNNKFKVKEGDNSCFSYFNPVNKKTLNWTLQHFTKALYALMDFTKQTLKHK